MAQALDAGFLASSGAEPRVRDFVVLLKPRVMSLVVFTGFAGLWVAPGSAQMHPFIAFVAMLCLAVGAGAAGAFNMWYDRDIDAVMVRTRTRPIPGGRVDPDAALAFSVILTGLAVMMMGLAVNWVAASLLAFASFFYAGIYTVALKRRTAQNIVIGGAAGAFPPLIGWTAVTGEVSLAAFALFAIVFLWTPPHFWALSLFSRDDYQRAGIPMMPVVQGEKSTKIQMLVYSMALVPATLAPWVLGVAGAGYALTAFALSVFFVYTSIRVLRSSDLRCARQMFGFSIFYLFALFLALMIDAVQHAP